MTKKILLIDDLANDVQLTLYALKACGIESSVVEEFDGAEGLLRLADDPDISLVLLDLKLPKVNGFEFLKIVRSNPRFVGLPIVIVSNSNVPSDRTRAEVLGSSGYVVKDLDLQQFKSSLCLALEPFRNLLVWP
jgi:CheY-like chemotaxis protein